MQMLKMSPAQKCNQARQIVQRYDWDSNITEQIMDQAESHMLTCKHPDPQHFCHVYREQELFTQEEEVATCEYKTN